jgi:hypothetical protein
MKKINLIVLGLALILFAGCDKEKTSGGNARVTNYPIFEMSGDNPMFLALGETFTEPGVVALEGGAEIDVSTSVSGAYQGGSSIDVNASDCYDVTYSATNQDGFDGSATRTVYVVETGDLVNSIAGLYTSTIVRNGVPRFSGLQYVLIYDKGGNEYGISCGIGSYYQIGTGYGIPFNAPTSVVANDIPNNDFTLPTFSSGYGGWPWPMEMTDFTVDAANKKINMTTSWAIGYVFESELTQVQF